MALTGAFAESVSPVGTSPKAKTKQMLNKGPRRPLLGYRGNAPAPAPQRKDPSAFRESSGFEKQPRKKQGNRSPLYDYLQRSCLSVLLSILLFIVFCVDSSFSTLRKKQRGPEGADDLA